MQNIGVVRSINTDADIHNWNIDELHQLKNYNPYVFNISREGRNRLHRNSGLQVLDQLLEKDQLNLLIARPGKEAVKVLPIKMKWQYPLVIDCRSNQFYYWATSKKKRKERKRLFRVADHFLVSYQDVKEKWVKEGCPSKKISVLWNGINPHQEKYIGRDADHKGKISLLVPVSRSGKHSSRFLMNAFQSLLKQKIPVELIVWDMSRHHKVKKKWKKKLPRHTRFVTGLNNEKTDSEIKKADICCLHDFKINDDAMMKILANGLPVITYDDKHLRWHDWLVPSRNTIYIPDNKKKAWIDGIIELINSSKKRREMGRQSTKIVIDWYDRQQHVQMIEGIFDRLLAYWGRIKKPVPLFSVVIPTYNRKKYVKRAVKSVLKQTCQDYEIIVVDDGSKDGTRKMIESMSPRVRYIYQRNQGPSQARNTGILHARGKYISFLDSDDRYLPRKLEKNKNFLIKNPKCMFLYSWYYDKRKRHKKKQKPKSCKKLNEFRYRIYRREFTIRTSTVVVHRDCFKKTGLFNPKYQYAQDWDMWLRLAGSYMGYCQKKPLVIYRRHDKKKNKMKVARYHKKIKKNAKKLFGWNKKKMSKLERKYRSKYKKKKRKERKKQRKRRRNGKRRRLRRRRSKTNRRKKTMKRK